MGSRFGNGSEVKAASQQIQRLIVTSYHVSFTALILCVHHLGRDSLYLGPCAFLLTLLHHGLILYDQRKANATAPDFPIPSTAPTSSVSLQPLRRIPLSSTVPVIFVGWVAGIIWLAASAVVSSALGVSFWAHPGRQLEHTFLFAEVGLTLLEAVLLMIMAASCLRERYLVRHSYKVRFNNTLAAHFLTNSDPGETLYDVDDQNVRTL